jgi:hypothetical protein
VLDIAHISFLEMIQALIQQNGAAVTKGTLMRIALKAAEKVPETALGSFDEFYAAIESGASPIARVEGKARSYGGGLFGLPTCPFAASIAAYKSVFGALPESFKEVTHEFNAPSAVCAKYHVGHGAGVSPFCAVHQPIRSAIGDRLTVGGRKVEVVQLGCKAGDGKKAMAAPFIESVGLSSDVVDSILNENMCCYVVRATS